MANDFSLEAVIKANTIDFEKGMKRAESGVSNLAGGIGKVTKLLKTAFVVAGVSKLGKAFADVSKSMANARSIIAKGTGAIGENLNALTSSVSTLMREGVGRSAEEIGQVVADLNTRLGVTGDEVEILAKQFDDFADVTGSDFKNAVNGVADVMAKFGISSKDTGKLLDQLTVASQSSGASVEELESGLKTGASLFEQFGMGITESTAYLASLKKNGIDTGTAIMSLRTALAKFSAEGKNSSEELQNVVDRIKNASTESEALQISFETFGSRGGAEMVKAIRSTTGGLDDMTASLGMAGGAIRNTVFEARTSVDAFDDLKASISGVFSELLGGDTDTKLRNFVDHIQKAIEGINVERIREKMAEVRDGLVIILNFLGGAFDIFRENVSKVIDKLKGVFERSNGNAKSWKDGLYNILNGIYKQFQIAFGFIGSILDGDFKTAWNYAKLNALKGVQKILNVMSWFVNNFQKPVNKIIEMINKIIGGINEVREWFNQEPLDMKDLIKDPVNFAKDLGIEQSIAQIENEIEKATGKKFGLDPEDLEEQKEKWQSLFDSVGEGATDLTEIIYEESEKQKDAITDNNEEANDEINAENEAQKEKEKKNWKDRINNAVQIAKSGFQKLKSIISTISSAISRAVQSIFSGFNRLINLNLDDALNAVLEFEDKVLTFFIETLPQMPYFIESVLQSVAVMMKTLAQVLGSDAVKETFASILATLSEYMPSILNDLYSVLKILFSALLEALSEWFQTEAFRQLAVGMATFVARLGVLLLKAIRLALKSILQKIPVIRGIGKMLNWWATGTNNAESGLAVVGEKGPELIDMHGGERVYNAQNTKAILSGAGSSGNTWNVTFNNMQDTTAYAMMKQLKQYNRVMAINGIL